MGHDLRQPVRVLDELRGDVVTVVVVPERRVTAKLCRVVRGVAGEHLQLLDEAGDDHVADEGNQQRQDQIDEEDHEPPTHLGLDRDRVYEREEGEREEHGDRQQLNDPAHLPDEVERE